ncbi:hypothetical protein FIBSPDRAFT_862474 [Athelia psychrophila]|uniref:Uncharacterized protein n=1 Tax=Athelia psychrophila TaxID=1759441 RepID=A0A166IFV4_9AGAM|nr:hypothetical protein FIBSPDRAFT_862474 [Fibularhizoctonia sp. CBS 109695]
MSWAGLGQMPQLRYQTILDVAMAEESPSIAMNIVHPRPSSWFAIVGSISNALHVSRP